MRSSIRSGPLSRSTEQSGTDTRLLVVQNHHPKEPVDDAITKADQMQKTEVESTGELITAMTDHAETEERVESHLLLLDSRDIVKLLPKRAVSLQSFYPNNFQTIPLRANPQRPSATDYVTTFLLFNNF